MLTVHGRATSSNVQAVVWGLEEMGVPYRRVDVGGKHGGLDDPAFRALNPFGRVPALELETGQGIFESMAILRYLAATYGGEKFWPKDPADRARVDMWAEWAKVGVAMNFSVPIFWRVVRVPEGGRDDAAINTAVEFLESALAVAENQLAEHGFLAGPEFTLADIALGHILYRYFTIEIQRGDLPQLAAYYARLKDRSAYRKGVMVSYEELRGVSL
ncbi:MAG: glutathione S-transferase family protein [Pseudomonadota bacterium]